MLVLSVQCSVRHAVCGGIGGSDVREVAGVAVMAAAGGSVVVANGSDPQSFQVLLITVEIWVA